MKIFFHKNCTNSDKSLWPIMFKLYNHIKAKNRTLYINLAMSFSTSVECLFYASANTKMQMVCYRLE